MDYALGVEEIVQKLMNKKLLLEEIIETLEKTVLVFKALRHRRVAGARSREWSQSMTCKRSYTCS